MECNTDDQGTSAPTGTGAALAITGSHFDTSHLFSKTVDGKVELRFTQC